MKLLKLKEKYCNITSFAIAQDLYTNINSKLESEGIITIDFEDVLSLTTSCAKDIFGKLYLELGAKGFHDKIQFLNTKEDFRIIIQEGILDSLKSSN